MKPDIVFLSSDFYNDYPSADYPEILHKLNRPYAMVCVQIDNITFAIPFRSHISHSYAFWTDKQNCCGLDYSKAIVIDNIKYIDRSKTPHIRNHEFQAIKGAERKIALGLQAYIKKYKKAKTNLDNPVSQYIINCSSLQYFETQIGI